MASNKNSNPLTYIQTDFNVTYQEFITALQELRKKQSVSDWYNQIKHIDRLYANHYSKFEVLKTLAASSKNFVLYEHELNRWYEQENKLMPIDQSFATCLLKNKFKNQVTTVFSPLKFKIANNILRTAYSKSSTLLAEERYLLKTYEEILAAAYMTFNGVKIPYIDILRNPSLVSSYDTQDCIDTINDFLIAHEETLLDLYKQILKNRWLQAKELNFDDYSDLALKKSNRTDYSLSDLISVSDYINVISQKYTADYQYPLKKNYQQLSSPVLATNNLLRLLTALSPSTKQFAAYLIQNEALIIDDTNINIASILITFVNNGQSPYITINHTSLPYYGHNLLYHVGKAYHMYMARGLHANSLLFSLPTVRNVVATSFQFSTWPWLYKLLGSEAYIYQYLLIKQAINNLRYNSASLSLAIKLHGSENPDFEKESAIWLKNRAVQWQNYTSKLWLLDNKLLKDPYNSIDNIIGTLIGMQFWQLSDDNDYDNTIEDLTKLAKESCSMSLQDLITKFNLASPVKDATVDQFEKKVAVFLRNQVQLNRFI